MWGKGWRFLWLLPLPLSLLAGDRDPFLPPEDRWSFRAFCPA